MKGFTFALFFALIFSSEVFILEAQEQKLDSLQYFRYDLPELPNDWLMQNRDHYTYDNGGTEYTSYTRLNKDNTASMTWLESTQQIRTFNAQDKLDTDIFMYWDGSDWVNSSRSVYTYDASGNNNLITYFNFIDPDWIENGNTSNTFNGSNLIVETISQFINPATMLTENVGKEILAYSGDLLMSHEYYNWNTVANDWDATAYFRNLYNYSGSLIDDITSQSNDGMGSGWINTSLIDYEYDGENINMQTVQTWNDLDDDWEDSSQTRYTYDMNDQIIEVNTFSWIFPEFWIPNFRIIAYWSEAALSITDKKLLDGKAYPNPFNSELNISLKSALETEGLLQIFDINSKEISKTELNKGTKYISMNNPSLANGIYFVKITNQNFNQTFKVIKE